MKKSILVFISMILGGTQIGLGTEQPAASTATSANKANVASGEICPKDTGNNTPRSTPKVPANAAAAGGTPTGQETGNLGKPKE